MHQRRQELSRFAYLQKEGYLALMAMVLILCIATVLYYRAQSGMWVNWLLGVLIGIVLDRSRFCFTAAFRDPMFYGMSRLTKGMIVSLMVTTVGFALIQYYEWLENSYVPGNIYPLGWNIFIGAAIFGLGAAIAGSCASGTLMRIGEGFGLQWVVLVGLILGSLHGTLDAPWWYAKFSFGRDVIHLPTQLGWVKGVGVQLFVLALIYGLVSWNEKRHFKGSEKDE